MEVETENPDGKEIGGLNEEKKLGSVVKTEKENRDSEYDSNDVDVILEFHQRQKEYERLSSDSWAKRKFGRSPCFALLLGFKVLNTVAGVTKIGHAYRDTLRAIELEKDGFVVKSVAKEATSESEVECFPGNIPEWHLSANFAANDFVSQICSHFDYLVFKYIVFDYLNSPHAWIRTNWGPGTIANIVSMAESGYIQKGSIVEMPFTEDVKSWIDANSKVL